MEGHKIVDKIISNIEKVIVGKRKILELAMISILSEGHILLEDVPGTGKTTFAKTLAKTIGCGFNRIQFTPDTLPSDVTGVSIYNMQKGSFEFVKGSVMNHVVLVDEINRASPKTQASLLEAMAERQVTVDTNTYILPRPFMVIATQNSIDSIGTYHLPEAQLDRFFMKLSMGYPNKEEEKNMVNKFLLNRQWREVNSVTDEYEICNMQDEVMKVEIHEDLVDYILKITQLSRNNEEITLGISPRATLDWIKGAQSMAYCRQRNYVIPDDVLEVFEPIIAHRILLSSETRMKRVSEKKVLSDIRGMIRIPIL
ncbi:AAA domain-containing protein [Clostridium chromiireducens]|uniref:AAA domain-containing protein n=1 Tax=Clostridium chromiireducens TaxID=225345 RepID=A0A964RPN8_9CLOT|nr:MoxR family ATPase [Clostridium chromiireducens]MVX65551.1 AAA domain-containing protein [Clostridium chromiireducens]